MRVLKRHIGPVLYGCLAFSCLLPHTGHTLTPPAKLSGATAPPNLGHIPPYAPSSRPARLQCAFYDRPACRLACENVGFWAMEKELTHRLINACKIGCNLGQDHCR